MAMSKRFNLEYIDYGGMWDDTYTKGHVDKASFAAQVNAEHGCDYSPDEVEHVYMRKVPSRGSDYDCLVYYVYAGRGAFPATVIKGNK